MAVKVLIGETILDFAGLAFDEASFEKQIDLDEIATPTSPSTNDSENS